MMIITLTLLMGTMDITMAMECTTTLTLPYSDHPQAESPNTPNILACVLDRYLIRSIDLKLHSVSKGKFSKMYEYMTISHLIFYTHTKFCFEIFFY